MNNPLSSFIFILAGIFLMISGGSQMLVKAESEMEGSTGGSLLAESVRSNGCQSFGIGLACIALGAMPGRKRRGRDDHESTIAESTQHQASSSLRPNTNKSSIFSDEDWASILEMLKSANKGDASLARSYMTSSQTAAVCNAAGGKVADVEKLSTGQWVVKS
jgi:hypothetical protein